MLSLLTNSNFKMVIFCYIHYRVFFFFKKNVGVENLAHNLLEFLMDNDLVYFLSAHIVLLIFDIPGLNFLHLYLPTPLY